MEQVDGTVGRHITRTSLPNERESTALVIFSGFLSIDCAKMLCFASFKGKGGTLVTRTRRTPDSPARTPLTRGDTRCLAISLTCGTVIE